MNKENTSKKQKGGGLALAAGLLKGLNNERAALDEKERSQVSEPNAVAENQPLTLHGNGVTSASAGHVPHKAPSEQTARFKVAIADCISNPYNPREFYPEAKIQDLALTLKRDGQIEAIKITSLPQYAGKHVVIDGERRLRAMKSLGETFIEAERRADTTPVELYSTAYRANNDHERQTIFDDAIAWRRLIDDAVFPDQSALAERVGRDKAYVSKVLSLNSLPRLFLERMAESADRVGLQAAYFLKLIFDKAGEEQADRALSSVIIGKKTVRQLELQVRDLSTPGITAKKSRIRYHQMYDFKSNGATLGQLKTFPDGRISLELSQIPEAHQEALAEKLKSVVDSFAEAVSTSND